MATLEELLKEGKKVTKGEKKKPKESVIRERYNLDALMEIAKQTLKGSETYKYPHRKFAKVVGFEPIGKMQRQTSGGLVTKEYNISLPTDLRVFIESDPIEGFDDTIRIRMSGDGKVVVEPFREYQKRLKQKRERRRKNDKDVNKKNGEDKTTLDMQEKVAELQKIISDLSEGVNSFNGMCEKCIANKLLNSPKESSVKEKS